MLQSMGWQREGHDWATELNWTKLWIFELQRSKIISLCFLKLQYIWFNLLQQDEELVHILLKKYIHLIVIPSKSTVNWAIDTFSHIFLNWKTSFQLRSAPLIFHFLQMRRKNFPSQLWHKGLRHSSAKMDSWKLAKKGLKVDPDSLI